VSYLNSRCPVVIVACSALRIAYRDVFRLAITDNNNLLTDSDNLCWSTDLRVRAELALAQNKRTAHYIYRGEEHLNRTPDFNNILVNAYLCAQRVSPVVISTLSFNCIFIYLQMEEKKALGLVDERGRN
jgi:hypothetical protein